MSQFGCGPLLAIMVILMVVGQDVLARRRDTRLTFNEYVVMHKAQRFACQRRDCSLRQCVNPGGWHLLATDYGCCGNYDGCCQLALSMCWFHDVFCRCCDYGILLCGPLCRRDPDCRPEEGSGVVYVA